MENQSDASWTEETTMPTEEKEEINICYALTLSAQFKNCNSWVRVRRQLGAGLFGAGGWNDKSKGNGDEEASGILALDYHITHPYSLG